MNKKIALFFSLFVIWQSVPAHEVKALLGFSSSKYVFSDSTAALDQQRKSGLNFGFGWAYKLGKNMKVEVDAMFSQKGANVTITNTPDSVIVGVYKNSSVAIPCFFKYQFMEKRSPYFSLGPEFVFITSHHLVFTETNSDYDLSDMTKKFVLAFNAAVGYEYPFEKWTMFAEIRYSNWLSSILKDSQGTVKSESFVFIIGGIYYL